MSRRKIKADASAKIFAARRAEGGRAARRQREQRLSRFHRRRCSTAELEANSAKELCRQVSGELYSTGQARCAADSDRSGAASKVCKKLAFAEPTACWKSQGRPPS